jgi:hypothetical protein
VRARWGGAGAALLAVLGVAGAGRAAPVLEIRGELEAAGGHDDNMLLSVADSGDLVRVGGAYAGLAPALALSASGGGYQLSLSYLADARTAEEAGRLIWQQLGLELRAPALGPVRLSLAGFVGRFDANRFAEEQFRFVGGELRARLALSPSLRLAGRYRPELRALGTGGTDVAHAGELRLLYAPTSWLDAGPRLAVVNIVPRTAGASSFLRTRAGLDVTASAGPWEIALSPFAGTAGLTGARETLFGGRADLRVDLGSHVSLFAAYDLTASTTAGSSYARRVALVGLLASANERTAPRPLPVTDLAPRLEAGKVRFRVRAPGAASVTVVGSWNEWEAPGTALQPTREPGLWEGFATLERGAHRYHFLVDGQATRPPSASRYVPDGFGGDDGVVDVEQRGTP